MKRKIGMPTKWHQYKGQTVVATDFLGNELSSLQVGTRRNFDKAGKPVDKDEWHMNPSMVNAYYSPSANEMAFPAGILQPPFFSAAAPPVLNFATIGAVMGHELTHGFDDQGAQYDAKGNLKVWWSNSSVAKFKAKTNCVVEQYSKIKLPELAGVAPQLRINGKLTLGENIADNGGVVTALQAYETWQKNKKTPKEHTVNGKKYTTDELFWIGYGQTWCQKGTPEQMMVQIRTDPHSPARARVEGPVQNAKRFAKTMQCGASAAMNPKAKCVVW
jgi:predicted metalloendopeptidase